MKDILPPESSRWAALEGFFRAHSARYGFREIRTPLLERTELFSRAVGETTDIIEKEMYTFTDRSGDSLTARPEGTAPVVRAVLEHRSEIGEWPLRLFYMGPMFRHERPQKGRLRQFHQFGAEMFGAESPCADAEMIAFISEFFRELGLREISLEINSLGDQECRPKFNAALAEFLNEREAMLCADCRRRRERNPLRVLDCKSPECIQATAEAPSIIDFLCGPCRDHFAAVKALLADRIPFRLNPRMVRGLDYYRRTTFEFIIPGMGAQNTVAAGGRYDGLAEMIGGKTPVPAIGFALGVERLLMLLGESESVPADPEADVFLVTSSPSLIPEAFQRKMELVREGVRADMDYEGKSLKSQFRRAGRAGARAVIVFGEAEAERGMVGFRDMEKGAQEEMRLDEAMQKLHGLRKEK
ncbi:MAG: histidine--tRNA ligase [Syntrophorhabdaceae bacterium]|nr:histidine--tRNA ligase [Syntrophorhabdaceae bacterium]